MQIQARLDGGHGVIKSPPISSAERVSELLEVWASVDTAIDRAEDTASGNLRRFFFDGPGMAMAVASLVATPFAFAGALLCTNPVVSGLSAMAAGISALAAFAPLVAAATTPKMPYRSLPANALEPLKAKLAEADDVGREALRYLAGCLVGALHGQSLHDGALSAIASEKNSSLSAAGAHYALALTRMAASRRYAET